MSARDALRAFRPRIASSRDYWPQPDSWVLVERYVKSVQTHPREWRLVFRRSDEVIEVTVSEEAWRAFDS